MSASIKTDLVITKNRYVVLLNFPTTAQSFVIGLTNTAFDAIRGETGERIFAQSGITNNSAEITRIMYTTASSSNSVLLRWGQEGHINGPTAFICQGQVGDFNFERMAIKNTATGPSGTLVVTTVGGGNTPTSVLLEFAVGSGSITPPGYLSL